MSNQRVSVFPEDINDVDPIIRRNVDTQLRHIREIASKGDVPGTVALSAEEAFDGILRSMGSDWKAPEKDVEYNMKADMRGWWRDFPEQKLLSEFYEQAACPKEGTGNSDDRRLCMHTKGLQVARALLADIRITGELAVEWEAAAVVQSLVDLWLHPIGGRSRATERAMGPWYITKSKSNRAYFDALKRICEELDSRGEAIPKSLDEWRGGSRKRPAAKPLPRGRPANPAQFARDIHIQFTIEILDQVGIRPMGDPSGCWIVAEAVERSEERVERIWRECPWRTSLMLMAQRYWKGIAKRHGLDQTR